MDAPDPATSPPGEPIGQPSYWIESRRELKEWFAQRASHLGDLYQGALIMLYADGFPGRKRLVSHAVREIRNRLPDVIAGPKAGPGRYLNYKNRLDHISMVWANLEIPLTAPIKSQTAETSTAPGIVPIPEVIFENIRLLVKDHDETREKPLEAATRLFEVLAPENKKLQIEIKPMILQWIDVTEWFVNNTHEKVTPSPQNTGEEEQLLKQFELFEVTLGALVSKQFFKTIKELDEILEDTNTPTD